MPFQVVHVAARSKDLTLLVGRESAATEDSPGHGVVADHGALVLLQHAHVRTVDVPEVGDHLLSWRTSALLELLRCVIRLLPLRAVVLAVQHLHHVAETLGVRLEVRRVDAPENVSGIALRGQEDEAGEVAIL